jgi:hypothetical protein
MLRANGTAAYPSQGVSVTSLMNRLQLLVVEAGELGTP